jgi:hypothetical protein
VLIIAYCSAQRTTETQKNVAAAMLPGECVSSLKAGRGQEAHSPAGLSHGPIQHDRDLTATIQAASVLTIGADSEGLENAARICAGA